jgi:hypothetical protein
MSTAVVRIESHHPSDLAIQHLPPFICKNPFTLNMRGEERKIWQNKKKMMQTIHLSN